MSCSHCNRITEQLPLEASRAVLTKSYDLCNCYKSIWLPHFEVAKVSGVFKCSPTWRMFQLSKWDGSKTSQRQHHSDGRYIFITMGAVNAPTFIVQMHPWLPVKPGCPGSGLILEVHLSCELKFSEEIDPHSAQVVPYSLIFFSIHT